MKKYGTSDIRNVVLLSHGGHGTTSLGEAILFNSGAVNRLGSVDEGNSIFDFEDEERERKNSISAGVAACEFNKRKLNLIDLPGLADFVGDERAFEARYYDHKLAPKRIKIDLVRLPAKALYKNFDSLYVSSIIQGNDDFCQVEDQKPDCQKFISEDSQLCLELDQERLRLHASSMNSLNNSMEAVEKLCGEKIFFLAKTMDNVTNCQISN